MEIDKDINNYIEPDTEIMGVEMNPQDDENEVDMTMEAAWDILASKGVYEIARLKVTEYIYSLATKIFVEDGKTEVRVWVSGDGYAAKVKLEGHAITQGLPMSKIYLLDGELKRVGTEIMSIDIVSNNRLDFNIRRTENDKGRGKEQ
jgi:hypothetical protein